MIPRAEVKGSFARRQLARLSFGSRAFRRLCRVILPFALVVLVFVGVPVVCGLVTCPCHREHRMQREVELVQSLARTMLEMYAQQPISDRRIEVCLRQRDSISCLASAFDLGDLDR